MLIVVEGQTEERFVKDVLAPWLAERQVFIRPTVVVTKVVKDGANFKGGITSFAKFRDHLERVLSGAGGALVTTMIDYYGLPADFPGMASRPMHLSMADRVRHVETALTSALAGPPHFVPFMALHEFEAWLFSDAVTLPRLMVAPQTATEFAALTETPPEDINDGSATAPSKRLLRLYPAYRKTLHGPTAAARIGLPAIRARCPHLAQWLSRLEAYGEGESRAV